MHINNLLWSDVLKCETKEGKYKIPLLEDIMKITKWKMFMNLEIKDENEEIWEIIQELIEKNRYYNQISISSFQHKYYEKIEQYNNVFNRRIVFSFLYSDIIGRTIEANHQILINAIDIMGNKELVEEVHNNRATVGIWFKNEQNDTRYYELFELGIDVIITDYPMRVSEQLNQYYSDINYLEGCDSLKETTNNIISCKTCKNGYELVKNEENNRLLCKLKYEINPDLYRAVSGVYYEKNIFAIKMLWSPIDEYVMCKINKRTIFYFVWLFDLFGYDQGIKRFIFKKESINYEPYTYSQLTEEHIKKLNFTRIEIYIDDNLIDPENFMCKDLYESVYYGTYRVVAANCYLIYNGESKEYYFVKFRLFDDDYLSFVTYDNKFLSNRESWRKDQGIYYDTYTDSFCDSMKDPFQERISCTDKINNCMYCENENTCEKCKYGFSLVNGECLPSKNFENNLKYYTPDKGINYYSCESMIKNCEECSYDYLSFNKFHCTKCSKDTQLSDTYECINMSSDNISEKETNIESIENSEGNFTDTDNNNDTDSEIDKFDVSSGKFIEVLISTSLLIFLTFYI